MTAQRVLIYGHWDVSGSFGGTSISTWYSRDSEGRDVPATDVPT